MTTSTSCKPKRILFLDCETYSETDLKSSGSHKYFEDPAFEVLLIQYAWGDAPVRVIDLKDPTSDRTELDRIVKGLRDPDVLKVAHIAPFERGAFAKQFGFYQRPEEWLDTAVLCAMNGLPMSLDAAGEALQVEQKKLKTGKALINYFCKPCKPTKANGGRTRNLPEHAPEKWAQFKEYGGGDVVTMRLIFEKLKRFHVSDFEKQLQALDARINERGVLVDPELVESAIAVDDAVKAEHFEEMQKLTGLDNPNSVPQLKAWLETVGVYCEGLDKETVKSLLGTVADPITRRVLELRQLLGKTSTTKYKAMTNAACRDNRVRGLLQFYGAGRTGRWAGRLVQVQNLAQNHLDHIDQVRELVRSRDIETLELCYDSVPDVLSQLIRTAFVAKDGHTFLVADFSAIEARVIAYLAGEQWRMDVFANGGDIYCSSASQMFKVPVEKHGVNGHLRQKGKVAELACIAEGQEVLTDVGLVPIEKVTKSMKVWDGIEWVSHDGVVYKGEKEVITYEGLTGTADHVVWAEIGGQPRAIHLGDAAARGAHLVQAGAGRQPLRVGGDHQPREEMEREAEPLLRPDPMQRVREGTVARAQQLTDGQVEGLPVVHTEASGTAVALQTLYRGQATMHEPPRPQLQELRGEGHPVPFLVGERGVPLHDRGARTPDEGHGARPHQPERQLRARESALGISRGKLLEPTQDSPGGVGPDGVALLAPRRDSQALAGRDEGPDHGGRAESRGREAQGLANHRRKARVFDILNAGPRHRFTVSDVLVHNCGYGGGVNALKAFGADKMGLTESEMQEIVTQWRLASPTIPRLWSRVEDAAKTALKSPGRRCVVLRKYRDVERARRNEALTGRTGYSLDFNAGGAVCTYWRDKDALRCQLPSGRVLTYWGARLDNDGKICFMGQNQTTRKWERTDTWGGKLVENIVQAYARDCLAVSMLRLDEAGFRICFHVHDEIVAEAPEGARWQDMAEIMNKPIDWAPGLLLRADGYDTKFYRKD